MEILILNGKKKNKLVLFSAVWLLMNVTALRE